MAATEPKSPLVERLFAEHRGALQTFFLRRIRAKADAADLAQEVYVRMLRISDQDTIRNPVHYLYTVANNLVKEHAVLERRRASGIDIDEAPANEQLETLPEFDGDLDATQRIARLGACCSSCAQNAAPRWSCASRRDSPIGRWRCTSEYRRRWRRNTWYRRWVIVDAAWRGWVESMITNDEKVRAAIAEQAGEWFVADEEGPLDAQDSAALAAWLRTSPVHVEEFLGVSVIARDLKQARTDAEYSLEAILARARAEHGPAVRPLRSRVVDAIRGALSRRWLPAALAMAACALLSLGFFFAWHSRPSEPVSAHESMQAEHFETRHGEQLTRRLADNSVLHLNTDTAVTIRFDKKERRVVLNSGQAEFEVAHESDRAFRVFAGATEVVDLGTIFDVRLEHDSTVITVVEGRASVGPSSAQSRPRIQVRAGQQLRVSEGEWPAAPVAVDTLRATAWLHREIVFDHEPLERVTAEYNRYTTKPIEIATPALRSLQISGDFAVDDTDAFIAFLRSLKGVRVEETDTRIRVSRD
jgi:transmembrane sensor